MYWKLIVFCVLSVQFSPQTECQQLCDSSLLGRGNGSLAANRCHLTIVSKAVHRNR